MSSIQASFTTQTNPSYAQPLSACGSDEEVSVQLGADVYEQRMRVWFQSSPVCGARVCWDGELQERQPVVAPLRVVKVQQPRPCLSRPEISPVDLEPLVAAFKASYPSAAVEIELALAGWMDEEIGRLILKPTP